MKKPVFLILVLCITFLISGCATSRFGSNESYLKYVEGQVAVAEAERKPLLDLTLDDTGRVASIQMYPQPVHVKIEQEKDHPVYAVVGGIVRVFGLVGAIWQTGEAIEGIVEASSGDVTHINSANNNSENAGSLDLQGDYATTKTETFDAEYSPEE